MTGEGRIMATLTLHDDPLPLSVDEVGRIRVAGARIFIQNIVARFNQGMPAEEIARGYDTLTLADVYATLAYYLRHKAEVDEYVRQLAAEAEAIRAEFEAKFPPKVSRDELRARRDALLRRQP